MSSSAITLSGGVLVGGNTGPIISSLDLTDPTTVTELRNLQIQGELGGALVVNSLGQAVGGSITFPNDSTLVGLTAQNIPAGVTVAFMEFDDSNLISVSLTNTSTSQQAIVAGNMFFINGSLGGSVGNLNITSTQPGPVLVVTGQLRSDGNLNLSVGGDISVDGIIGGNQDLSVVTTNNGNVNIRGRLIGGDYGMISAGGSGSINRIGSGQISAPTLDLSSGSGNIGSLALPILSATYNLTVNTSGSAFVNNVGALTIGASALGGTLQILSTVGITTSGAISAANLTLGGLSGNVGIILNGDINSALSSGLVTLKSLGSGMLTQSAGTVYATTLSLLSGNGNIGMSAVLPFTVDADTVSAVTKAKNVYIKDLSTSPVTLQASSASSVFQFESSASLLTISGNLAASNVTVKNVQGGIAVGTSIGKSTQIMTFSTAGGAGTFTTLPGALIAGKSISITGGTGDVGSAGSSANLATTSLALSGAGSMFVNNTSSSLMLAGSTLPGSETFKVVTSGSLTTTGAIVADEVVLQAGSKISLGGNIGQAGGSVAIAAGSSGSVTVNNIAHTLTGMSVTISSMTGSIGDSKLPIKTAAGELSMTTGTKGKVYVTNTGNTELVGASGGTFQLLNNGNLDVAVDISQVSTLILQTNGSNGNIALLENVGMPGGKTTIAANGSGIISQANGKVIKGATVTLVSDSGDMGSAVAPLQTSASKLSANTTGSIYVNGADAILPLYTLTVTKAVAGGTLNVTSSGNLVLIKPGPITAPTISFATNSGSNGSIYLSGPVGSASSSVSIVADGSGSIVGSTYGTITGSSVVLSSTTGNIGGAKPVVTIINGTLDTHTTGAGVTGISNTGALTLLDSESGGAVNISSKGALTVNELSTVNGSISLLASAGALTVNANQTVSALNGNLTIRNTTSANPKITIGIAAILQAASPTTGFGNVNIVIGSVPSKPTPGNSPGNVQTTTTAGGNIFYGKNGITSLPPDNVLTAQGRNIVFEVGKAPATAIELQGGVQIDAKNIGFNHSDETIESELLVDTGEYDEQENADELLTLSP